MGDDQMDYEFRRPDLYAGLLLGAVSLGVIVESWRMPRDLLGWPAYAGPGMVTGLLGLVLLALAFGLCARAWRRAGHGLGMHRDAVWRYLSDPQTRRLGLMTLLSVAYLAALGRGISYYLTTGTYLVLTMALFRATTWWAILLIAGGVTAGIGLVFNRIFLIPLP